MAIKDHFRDSVEANITLFQQVREVAGFDIDLFHDAAMVGYSYDEALLVGRALEDLNFGWFEEPLPDTGQAQLRKLCRALDIPILAPETLMHDMQLSAEWYARYYDGGPAGIASFTQSQLDQYTGLAATRGLVWAKG